MQKEKLQSFIKEDVSLRLIEQDIYSVYAPMETPGSFDKIGAAMIYDRIMCNKFYNYLMWGYSTDEYLYLCKTAIDYSSDGVVLDVACGSLAFTLKLYAIYTNRPVILLDQSLNLLKRAKNIPLFSMNLYFFDFLRILTCI